MKKRSIHILVLCALALSLGAYRKRLEHASAAAISPDVLAPADTTPVLSRALHPNYPYSVVPGGVYSPAELRFAAAKDRVVREHYTGFNIKAAYLVTLTQDRLQYVSFRRGDREAGVRAFITYVFDNPRAWDTMSASSRRATLRDAHEWDVMMTSGTLFPEIDPQTIRKISAPVLLLSGAKSYPFLRLITQELGRLLPNSQTIIPPDAGHQMWYQESDICRKDVEAFLARIGMQSSATKGRFQK